jgi:pilus assembly protein CpaD
MIRTVSILALAAFGLGACATAAGSGPAPVTPTERYSMRAAKTEDQIALTPHAEGLSEKQREALVAFAGRFAQDGAQTVTVRQPSGGGEAAGRTAWNVKAALESAGVPVGAVRIDPYDAQAGAPVLVAFERFAAVVPQCGRTWNDLTRTRDNQSQSNFGCAITANMAAQVENPADIAAPRDSDPSDAARRSVVMGKYRKGEPTGAQSDGKANGNVSTAVPTQQ